MIVGHLRHIQVRAEPMKMEKVLIDMIICKIVGKTTIYTKKPLEILPTILLFIDSTGNLITPCCVDWKSEFLSTFPA